MVTISQAAAVVRPVAKDSHRPRVAKHITIGVTSTTFMREVAKAGFRLPIMVGSMAKKKPA